MQIENVYEALQVGQRHYNTYALHTMFETICASGLKGTGAPQKHVLFLEPFDDHKRFRYLVIITWLYVSATCAPGCYNYVP